MVWSDNETKKEPRLDPLTIGIHGGWGAGKFSILKMLEESLDPMQWTEKESDENDRPLKK